MNKIAFIIVLCVGLGAAAIAFNQYSTTQSFLANAKKVTASVTNVRSRQATCTKGSGSSKSSYSCTKYDVIASFVTDTGEQVETEIVHDAGSQSYTQGQSLSVLYSPSNPREAKIEGFGSLWGGTIAAGIFSAVFFLIGAGGLVYTIRREKEIAWLKQFGTRVRAKFLDVEQHRHKSKNRVRYSYTIRCQWLNPTSGETHIFQSETLKHNPEDMLRGREIEVLIDPSNPGRYYVDISGIR